MSDPELLEEISRKLSAIIAISLLDDPKNLNSANRIRLLVRFGLTNQDIADIMGTTKGTVEVLKSRALKNRGKQ